MHVLYSPVKQNHANRSWLGWVPVELYDSHFRKADTTASASPEQ